jgi:opacity protein-like surface antigen
MEKDMKRFITTMMSAMLLGPALALAQEEQPAEVVPVEEPPAAEAPAEGAPAEGQSAEDAAAAEQPAQEEAAEEPYEGQGSGFVDVYYLPTSIVDFPGAFEEDGDGMGGRAQYQFWKFLAASAEYTYRKYDDADTDVTDTRLGIGAVTRNGSGDSAGLFLQYEKTESDFDDIDGYVLHGRLTHVAYDWFSLYLDLGYGMLSGDAEDYESIEIGGGMLFTIASNTGVFADWRRSAIEGEDSGIEPTIEDVRVGARISFGN